ncbi:NADH pyrophosphatase [Seminavis robusta]|uniref:NAD(+) diphosphatase n=1 Tax=Seminavis robusta TaxID=568900 RepID=A0A9N8DAU9_9STRA|nr:NADH pyrophosphatase [Seminavis robusta]|eukprot:Sro57_g033380.1 NADH pyrophosphatase (551) ;mRNA; f:81758-83410
MPSLSSPSFSRLVAALKQHKKTCTVIESSCGGLINASILAQPGASNVYYGGSVAYNTRRAKPLLLNNPELHKTLTAPLTQDNAESEKERYIQSKVAWTQQTAIAFCEGMDTDICIAEGGATGPTFRPEGLDTGFAVIAIAAKSSQSSTKIVIVKQKLIESTHANRQVNMRLFADRAAELALQVITGGEEEEAAAEDTSQATVDKPHFDRATHLRADPEQLEALAQDAHYVILHQNATLFQTIPPQTQEDDDDNTAHNRKLQLLSQTQVQQVMDSLPNGARKETTFLGLLNDHQAIFGVDILSCNDDSSKVETAIHTTLNTDECHFQDTRTVAPLLASSCENEIVLHATALAQWQRRAPHCTVCGTITRLEDGGTRRVCTNTDCGHQSWPRQDPSMIAVVSNRQGTKVLLGRSKRHPAKMHTALAGFVEAGETMERAVAREVYEETGIRVDLDSVRYVASQPWPFPQSTMIGFTVEADEQQTLNVDTNELVDARWFDRSEVELASTVLGPVMQVPVANEALADNPALTLLIPPKGVLARQLIDTWLEGSSK